MTSRDTNWSWLRPTGLALLCAVSVWGLWRYFVGTVQGQTVDMIAFRGSEIGSHLVIAHNNRLLQQVSVGSLGIAMALVAFIAMIRGRWLLALETSAMIAACNVTTQLLKYGLFTRERLTDSQIQDYYGNSLPSGHTTAAASLAIALVLVVPARLRVPTALASSVVMVAFGWSTMAAQWHRASDVVAGLLVCFGWAFAAIAVQALRFKLLGRSSVEQRPVAKPSRLWPGLMVALGTCGVAIGLWGLWRATGYPAIDQVGRRQLFTAYATATAAVVGTTIGGLGVVLRLVQLADARRDSRDA